MGSIPISALCRVVFELDDESFFLVRSLQENIQSSWEILTVPEDTRNGSCLPVDVLELLATLSRLDVYKNYYDKIT